MVTCPAGITTWVCSSPSTGSSLARRTPGLSGTIDRLVRTGQLTAVLPGVYAPPAIAGQREIRTRAVMVRQAESVLTGRTAAQLSFWPSLPGQEIECAVLDRRRPSPGFRFDRREIPFELVQERAGLRLTRPALTALDLCVELGGDAIDIALRTRTATLAGLHDACELTRHRRGHRDRRRLLLDSRDEPWSAAERLGHRLLRQAGITGWKANRAVVIDGQRYYLDVAFPALRLVVEIDGRLHEDDPDVFEHDRWRQNALVLQGWLVLRFTYAMLRDHPKEVIRAVRAAIIERTR